jgi:hypothetical protein
VLSKMSTVSRRGLTTVDNLLNSVRSALSSSRAITLSLTEESAANDCYEAYILGLVILAAQEVDARIWYEDVRGHIPTNFMFRTSPTHIYSTRQDYTHAVIELDGAEPLEVHMSVRYIGDSGVAHECDVSVLSRADAQIARLNGTVPRWNSVLFAIECKYYESNNVAIGLARGFLGLTREFSPSNSYFVVNRLSGNSAIILEKHRHNYEENVIPNTKEANRLIQIFSKEFARYKVRARQSALQSE